MSFFRSPLTWLRLTFRWSNSVKTWQERVADFVVLGTLLLTLAAGWWLGTPWWLLLACCAGFLAIPAFALGMMGWLKVFGPVLYYDMVRTARRGRFVWMRFCYALFLLFLLFCSFTTMRRGSWTGIDAYQAAEIAQNYFELFMVTQFVTVVLLTPAYVAGAIAEEKDRKTLEFMLATDLLNREIVLSKLGSRLANLALVVLTGLPILSILQFAGGIDPNLVVAGFIITAMTIAGQAGISIVCSVTCKRPRDAIALAYLAVVVYYGIGLLLTFAMFAYPGAASTPIWFGEDPPVVQNLVDYYNRGSLVTVIRQIKLSGGAGTLATDLPALVRDYSVFHGLLFLGCAALAIARIRRVALEQMYGKPLKFRQGTWMWPRRSVGNHPMLWKEVECEGGTRMNWIGLILFSLMLGLTLIPAGLIVHYYWKHFYDLVSFRNGLAASMNVWGRTCTVVVACLTLLGIGVRASTSITTERDKQTLDALLTSPLDSSTMLHAKWFGSILGVRLGLIWLVVIWAIGIVTGGLHMGAALFLGLAWLVYAAFVAALGLWFSVNCRTSLRATVMTILSAIGLGVGHWLIWLCCGVLMMGSRGGMDRTAEHIMKFQAGMTPPFVLGWLHIPADQFQERRSFGGRSEETELTVFSGMGLVAWSLAAAVLYAATSVRFRSMTNRNDTMYSDREMGKAIQPRRPKPPPLPVAPWSPPSGAVMLEEVEEDRAEGLDDDPSDWQSHRRE